MRVYVKKEDRRSMIPGIAAAIFMLAFSIGVFVLAMTSEPTLMDALKTYGILLLVALIFFGLGIYCVFAFFKRPKGYKAKLISKKTEIYNGEQITYMEFAAPKAEETHEEHMDTEDEDNEEYIDEDYE